MTGSLLALKCWQPVAIVAGQGRGRSSGWHREESINDRSDQLAKWRTAEELCSACLPLRGRATATLRYGAVATAVAERDAVTASHFLFSAPFAPGPGRVGVFSVAWPVRC